MQLSFLLFVFGGRCLQPSRHDLLNDLRSVDQCYIIMQLAHSLLPLIAHQAYNAAFVDYLHQLKEQQLKGIAYSHLKSNTKILINPECYLPLQVLCEKISLVLEQSYLRFQTDDILLIRREISLRSRLETDLILIQKYPENLQYIMDFAQMCLYTSRISEALILINKKINYFQKTGQRAKSDLLKPQRFILFANICSPTDQRNILNPDIYGRKQMYLRLVITYIESLNSRYFLEVFYDFKRRYPQSKDILPRQFIGMMISEKLDISPKQYQWYLQNINPQLPLYHMSLHKSYYMVDLIDESENCLKVELETRKGRDLYTRAALFYFEIGKYQLCLDYIFKLNMYVQIPTNCNLLIALCYLSLNQTEKALPIIRSAEQDRNFNHPMGLLLVYNRLGWAQKAINYGEQLIYWKSLSNLYAIKVQIIVLINYQKIGRHLKGIFDSIKEGCHDSRIQFAFLSELLSVFTFMCQFCYSSQDRQIFKHRQFFVRKVWSVIQQTEKYSKEGASRMTERFISKQPINIESEFLH